MAQEFLKIIEELEQKAEQENNPAYAAAAAQFRELTTRLTAKGHLPENLTPAKKEDIFSTILECREGLFLSVEKLQERRNMEQNPSRKHRYNIIIMDIETRQTDSLYNLGLDIPIVRALMKPPLSIHSISELRVALHLDPTLLQGARLIGPIRADKIKTALSNFVTLLNSTAGTE